MRRRCFANKAVFELRWPEELSFVKLLHTEQDKGQIKNYRA